MNLVDLGPGITAGFTSRHTHPPMAPDPTVGERGNLSPRRPHEPAALAAAWGHVAATVGLPVDAFHTMRQVHGRDVGCVEATTPAGAEVRAVDALVTAEPDRAVVVQVADCVPVLIAGTSGPVAAVHAGRPGIVAGVVAAAVDAMLERGAPPDQLRAAIGPAIGPCCYEVPAAMQADVIARIPRALATTSWGTPGLDLVAAAEHQLEERGVTLVGSWPGCTRCDPEQRWFSHRSDPGTGRQVGFIVRRSSGDAGAA